MGIGGEMCLDLIMFTLFDYGIIDKFFVNCWVFFLFFRVVGDFGWDLIEYGVKLTRRVVLVYLELYFWFAVFLFFEYFLWVIKLIIRLFYFIEREN